MTRPRPCAMPLCPGDSPSNSPAMGLNQSSRHAAGSATVRYASTLENALVSRGTAVLARAWSICHVGGCRARRTQRARRMDGIIISAACTPPRQAMSNVKVMLAPVAARSGAGVPCSRFLFGGFFLVKI